MTRDTFTNNNDIQNSDKTFKTTTVIGYQNSTVWYQTNTNTAVSLTHNFQPLTYLLIYLLFEQSQVLMPP